MQEIKQKLEKLQENLAALKYTELQMIDRRTAELEEEIREILRLVEVDTHKIAKTLYDKYEMISEEIEIDFVSDEVSPGHIVHYPAKGEEERAIREVEYRVEMALEEGVSEIELAAVVAKSLKEDKTNYTRKDEFNEED